MIKLTPTDDNVIVKIIEQETNTIGNAGIIQVAESEVAPSTLAEVLVPASESYYRNGELRPQPRFRAGDKVRIPAGKVGTHVPEAVKGEKWLAIAEDEIVYKIEDC